MLLNSFLFDENVPGKSKWDNQLSAFANATTYLSFPLVSSRVAGLIVPLIPKASCLAFGVVIPISGLLAGATYQVAEHFGASKTAATVLGMLTFVAAIAISFLVLPLLGMPVSLPVFLTALGLSVAMWIGAKAFIFAAETIGTKCLETCFKQKPSVPINASNVPLSATTATTIDGTES